MISYYIIYNFFEKGKIVEYAKLCRQAINNDKYKQKYLDMAREETLKLLPLSYIEVYEGNIFKGRQIF